MLDAYIIEKVKREQESQDSQRRPALEIPPPASEPTRPARWEDRDRSEPERGPGRGVVIIEL